jgi:hypothetical protein
MKVSYVRVNTVNPEMINVTRAGDAWASFEYTGKMGIDAFVTLEKNGEVAAQIEGEFTFLIPNHYGFNFLDAENKIKELFEGHA